MSSGGGHGAGGQERWLVTYADMITLLMVFFIVLYGMSEMDKKKMAGLAAALRMGFNNGGGNQIVPMPGQSDGVSAPMPQVVPAVVPPAQGETPKEGEAGGEKPKDQLQEIGQQLALDFAKDGRFTVYLSDRGLTLSLVGSAAFDSGKADLKPEFLPLLDAIAAKLSGLPNDISVEGFTDSDPINTAEFPSNWYLSVGRANEVRDYLEMKGIQAERMIVVGYGETRPLYSNATPEGKAKNRRVDIVVLRNKPVIDRGAPIEVKNP
jgi:chemotaxis protein MotB